MFGVVRDSSGELQFSLTRSSSNEAQFDQISALTPESIIQVSGSVQARPAAMINPNQSTGQVEVVVSEVVVLNPSAPTPITVSSKADAVHEDTRCVDRSMCCNSVFLSLCFDGC